MLLGKMDCNVSIEQDICTAFLSVMLNRKNFGEDYLSCYKRVESNLTQYYTITRIHSLIAKVSKRASRYRPSMSVSRVSRLELSKAIKSHPQHGRPSTHRIKRRKSSLDNPKVPRHRSSQSLLTLKPDQMCPPVQESIGSTQKRQPSEGFTPEIEPDDEEGGQFSREETPQELKIESYPQYFDKKTAEELCEEVATRCAIETSVGTGERQAGGDSPKNKRGRSSSVGRPFSAQQKRGSISKNTTIKRRSMYDARLIDRAVSTIAPSFDIPAHMTAEAWSKRTKATKKKVKPQQSPNQSERRASKSSQSVRGSMKQMQVVPSAFDISMDDLLAEMDEVAEAEKSNKVESSTPTQADKVTQTENEHLRTLEQPLGKSLLANKKHKKRNKRHRCRKRRTGKGKRSKQRRGPNSKFADKLKRMIEETQAKINDSTHQRSRPQTARSDREKKTRLGEWKKKRPSSASHAAVKIQARFRGNQTRQILEYGSGEELVCPRTVKKDLALLPKKKRHASNATNGRPQTAKPNRNINARDFGVESLSIRKVDDDTSHFSDDAKSIASESDAHMENVSDQDEALDSLEASDEAQAFIRGIRQRKEYGETRKKVVRVQSVLRGHHARKRYAKQRLKNRLIEDQKGEGVNATKLQAKFRGYRQRRRYRDHQHSVRKLQATVRGHSARKRNHFREYQRKLF